MKLATAHLQSTSAYSQSKHYSKETVPMKSGELPEAYEHRTWRNRMHVNEEGTVFIPPMAFANCIKDAAKRMSLKVPNKGKQTFTKHFDAGVMVIDPLKLDIKAEKVASDELFVPSNGQTGGGTRVTKVFPRIDNWEGIVTFHIIDDVITEDVFSRVLEHAGLLVGIGRFRPQNRGYYGRFAVKSIDWQEEN